MRRRSPDTRFEDGFTLVELIMTIIVLGILSVTVLPRFADRDLFESRGFREETMALLRYAQKSAVAQRRTVCVAVSATGLSLTYASVADSTTCDSALNLPSSPRGGNGLGPDPSSFKFLPSGATDQTGTITLTVTGETSIQVDATTGYVH